MDPAGLWLFVSCISSAVLGPMVVLRMIDDDSDDKDLPQVDQEAQPDAPEQEVLPPLAPEKPSSHRATLRGFSKRVLSDFAHDFRLHGPQAIARLREESASNYLRIAVSLIPKEVLLNVARPAQEMSDFELAQAAKAEREQQMTLLEHVQKMRSSMGESDMLLEAQRQVLDVIVDETVGDDDEGGDEDDAA
jgi:hypothetical protein